MAAEEKRLESLSKLQSGMLSYQGSGAFKMSELPAIEKSFEKQFHHPLPVSALGQTQVHQSLGLDHTNKVDVALNPDQPEGVWLRTYLERWRIPYLAFRIAITGAATGAHIHIGPGSPRLPLAQR
jgi:hypothetical protein